MEESGADMLKLMMKGHKLDFIYLTSGVNNLTMLQKHTKPRTVRIRSTNPVWSAMSMLASYIDQDLIWKAVNISPNINIIICPLYGISMDDFNKLTHPHPQQPIIDETVLTLNKNIHILNHRGGWYTPKIDLTIHTWQPDKQRWYHQYGIHRDGLHPRPDHYQQVADCLWYAIEENAIQLHVRPTLPEKLCASH